MFVDQQFSLTICVANIVTIDVQLPSFMPAQTAYY